MSAVPALALAKLIPDSELKGLDDEDKAAIRRLVDESINFNLRATHDRMEIADRALRVCNIIHGGRQPTNAKTLKWFADKVGIHAKTLSNWVYIKIQIYDLLSEEEKKEIKYDDLNRAYRSSREFEPEKKKSEQKGLNPENARKLVHKHASRRTNKSVDFLAKIASYTSSIGYNLKRMAVEEVKYTAAQKREAEELAAFLRECAKSILKLTKK